MSGLWMVQATSIVFLPGLVLGVLARRSFDFKFLVNLCLPLSLAFHFLAAQIFQLWEENLFGPGTTLHITIFLWALLTVGLIRRECLLPSWKFEAKRDFLIPLGCLAAGIFVAYQHLRLAGGWASLLPNHDGQNHAFMTKNILESGKLSVAAAQKYFPNITDSSGDFYPLGIHNLIARLVAGAGVDIPEATNIVLVVAVILYFVNMGLLVSEIESKKLIVSVFLPIGLVLVSPGFPWRPLAWGGLTLIVGLSMVPGVVSAAIRISRNRASFSELIALGVALFGVFISHIAEVGVILFIAPLLALGLSSGLAKRLCKHLIGSVGVLVTLCLPLLPSLLRGARERAYFMPDKVDAVQNIAAMLFYIGGYHSGMMIALSLVGFIFATRADSKYRGIAIGAILLGVTTFNLAKQPDGFFGDLTFPWYRQVERVNYNYYLILPVLAVSGVSGVLTIVKQKYTRLAIGLLIAAVMLSSIMPATQQLAAQYDQQEDVTPVGPDMKAAFRFLSERARSSLVLADVSRSSGAMWMYPLAGLKPLIVDYGNEEDRDRLWKDKLYLLDTVGDWKSDNKATRLLKQFNVRYLIYNDRSNAIGGPRRLSKEALDREETLSPIWTSDTTTVYLYRQP